MTSGSSSLSSPSSTPSVSPSTKSPVEAASAAATPGLATALPFDPSTMRPPPAIPSYAASSPPPPVVADGGGLRYSTGKLPLALVPPEAELAIAAVLRHGAKKYAPRNWERGMAWSECIACLKRHLKKWEMGEHTDDESGLPHLWHLFTNAAFLVVYEARAIGTDDRVPTATYKEFDK